MRASACPGRRGPVGGSVPAHRGVHAHSSHCNPCGSPDSHLSASACLTSFLANTSPGVLFSQLCPRQHYLHLLAACLSHPWTVTSTGACRAGSPLLLSAHITECLARRRGANRISGTNTFADALQTNPVPPGPKHAAIWPVPGGLGPPAPVLVPTGAALTVRDHGGLGSRSAEPPEVK